MSSQIEEATPDQEIDEVQMSEDQMTDEPHLDRFDDRWEQPWYRSWLILLVLIILFLAWTGTIYLFEPGIR